MSTLVIVRNSFLGVLSLAILVSKLTSVLYIIMAIRSIPETVRQQSSSDVESRGENSSCPYQEISGENQRQPESSINV